MDIIKSTELLKEVLQQVEKLNYPDFEPVKRLRDRLTMLIKKVFGEDSSYLNQLKLISFSPSMSFSGMSISQYSSSFNSGKSSLISILDTMLEDLQLTWYEPTENVITTDNSKQVQMDRIFIVHGHNEEMKQSVARTLEQLGLKPIILHEQSNKGRTVIEKFTDHSDVTFAIALLSADDIGYSVKEKSENGKFRARQNVILELGFFLGKLGRQRVVALFEPNNNFEFPSDYQGVIFIPYDKDGRWKFDLLKEFKACDYNVDANKIL